MELIQELQQKDRELSASIRQLRISGTAKAEAEKEYKIKLREEALKLRTEGMPVSLINQIVYGVPVVAELRLKRDIADTVYHANLEASHSNKLQMRVIENQIEREWGQANRT